MGLSGYIPDSCDNYIHNNTMLCNTNPYPDFNENLIIITYAFQNFSYLY